MERHDRLLPKSKLFFLGSSNYWNLINFYRRQKMNNLKDYIPKISTSLIIILIALIVVTNFTNLTFSKLLKLIFSFILFIPGYFISYFFFKGKDIDIIERVVLSIVFSISILSIVFFYSNFIGIKINFLNSLSIILLIIILSTLFLYYINKKKKT